MRSLFNLSMKSLWSAIAALVLAAPAAHAQVTDWCDSATPLPLNRVTPLNIAGGVLFADGGIGTLNTNDAQLTTDGGAAACFSNFSAVTNTFSAAVGRDTAWSFTPATTGTYSFRAGIPSASVNTVLYLTSSCQPPGYAYGADECVAAVNHTSGVGQEELSCVPLVAGTPVFLWVDEASQSAAGSNMLLELSTCFAETEPNDTPSTASPLACAVTGGIRTLAEVDYFTLGALPAGTRVFALTEGASSSANDFDLRVTTNTRTLEFDNNNVAGFFGDNSGLVAGTPLTGEAAYLRVNYANAAIRAEPYVLYSKVEVGAATPEVEPNNTIAQATTNASLFFSGFAGASGDVDFFAIQANEGDVIFAALDSMPDRNDAGTTAANLNFNLTLTDADGGTLLAVDDTINTFSLATLDAGTDAGTPFSPAEGLVWRARATGTYGLRVAKSTTVASAYTLSVSVGCNSQVPAVSDLTPVTGPVAGGTTVTITGTGFTTNSQVFINNRRAPLSSASATQLVVTTPAQDLEGPATVTVTDGLGRPTTSDTFTYQDPAGVGPTVTNVSPNHSPLDGGVTVTVTGTTFRDNVAVFFDGAAGTNLTRQATTRLTVTTPPGAAGPADVRVLNVDTMEATLTGGLIYDAAPNITGVTPSSGTSLGGETLTIAGSDFRAGTKVFINGVQATVSAIDPGGASITVTSPFSSVDGPVTVTAVDTWGQQGSLAAGFTYVFAGPVLATVTPVRGRAAGGTTVTVTGTGFRSGATVNFIVNSTPVAGTGVVVADGGTSLTAVTPAQTPGLADVQVVNPDMISGSLAGAFRFDGAPVITSITPSTGLTSGGTPVTITGQEFRTGATVYFGPSLASAIVIADGGTSLTANTPAVTLAGPTNVRVRNADTQEIIVDAGFTYTYIAPTLTAVSPSHGYSTGNTLITLTGTGFLSTPQTSGPPTVTVGGVAATSVTRVSATQLTARTPAGAVGAPVDVVVTNGDGQSVSLTAVFTYDAAPTFVSVAPDHGPAQGGTRITVTGTNFQPGASVAIGGVPACPVSVLNSTTLSATTIAQAAGVWPVSVTNPDGQTVTSATAVFTVDEAPSLVSLSPLAGVIEGGTEVTLTGTGFQQGAQVLFGALDATNVTVTSSTSMTVTTPAHASGLVTVTVRNPDSQSVAVPRAFQYVTAPTLLSLSPESGDVAGGEPVHIIGAGLANGATVSFGGVPSTDVTFLTSGELLAIAPPHDPGVVDVAVVSQGVTLTLSASYTYSRGQPVVSAVSPVSGTTAGGTLLSIVGTGFLPGATVKLDGQEMTPVTVVSGTLIRVTTVAHAEGAVGLSVTNADGQSGSLASAFSFVTATPPIDDTLRDGGSGTIGNSPDYTPVPGGVSCGCSSFDGGLSFAALGLLTLLSRRRRKS